VVSVSWKQNENEGADGGSGSIVSLRVAQPIESLTGPPAVNRLSHTTWVHSSVHFKHAELTPPLPY